MNQVYVPHQRREYDAEQQAIARRLDQAEPWWVIWYGTWTRRFFAIPAFDTPDVLILDARTPGELVEEMRAAEDASRGVAR